VERSILIGGDLPIRRIGLGAMGLTGPGVWGDPRDRRRALELLRFAGDLVDLIDTAAAYGPGTNESLIADALHPYREGLVVATKGGYRRDGPWAWSPDGHPDHLRAACEESLRRLRVDRIDLYQLHTVDRRVPLEESVGTLAELRAEGKIRHVGLSNVGVEQIRVARQIVPVASVQNRYNLAERATEPVLRACEADRIPFLAWFPFAKGAFLRKGGPLASVARNRGASPAQVALAWLLRRSPVLVPIPGTRSLEHLRENVAAASLSLTDDEVALLDGFVPSTFTVRSLARRGTRRVLGRTIKRLRGR
jgi:pyridoxine 4-dehydrogenase